MLVRSVFGSWGPVWVCHPCHRHWETSAGALTCLELRPALKLFTKNWLYWGPCSRNGKRKLNGRPPVSNSQCCRFSRRFLKEALMFSTIKRHGSIFRRGPGNGRLGECFCALAAWHECCDYFLWALPRSSPRRYANQNWLDSKWWPRLRWSLLHLLGTEIKGFHCPHILKIIIAKMCRVCHKVPVVEISVMAAAPKATCLKAFGWI